VKQHGTSNKMCEFLQFFLFWNVFISIFSINVFDDVIQLQRHTLSSAWVTRKRNILEIRIIFCIISQLYDEFNNNYHLITMQAWIDSQTSSHTFSVEIAWISILLISYSLRSIFSKSSKSTNFKLKFYSRYLK
jgi:hypothetical protein